MVGSAAGSRQNREEISKRLPHLIFERQACGVTPIGSRSQLARDEDQVTPRGRLNIMAKGRGAASIAMRSMVPERMASISSPAPDARPVRNDRLVRSQHMVAGVLRSRGEGVIRQHAQQGSDWKVRQ